MNIDTVVQPLTRVGSPFPLSTTPTAPFRALMGPTLTKSKKTKTCGICNKVFDSQGFTSHERSCRKKHGSEGSRRAHAELLSREKELGELTSY